MCFFLTIHMKLEILPITVLLYGLVDDTYIDVTLVKEIYGCPLNDVTLFCNAHSYAYKDVGYHLNSHKLK